MAISQEQLQVQIQKARKAGWSEDRINSVVGKLQGQVERPGFLKSVAKTFTQPIADYASLVGEAGRQALFTPGVQATEGRIEELKKQMFDRNLSPEERLKASEEVDSLSKRIVEARSPKFMTSPKQEYAFEQMSGDVGQGALYGARKGAGVASYLTPGLFPTAGLGAGAAIGQAGLSGALSGGLRSFGEDYAGVGDVAKGAAIGGAAGAAFQGLAEGARGLAGKKIETPLSRFGKDVDEQVTGIGKVVDKDPFFSENIDELGELTRKYGGSGSIASRQAKVQSSFTDITDDITGRLDQIKTPVSKARLTQLVNDKLDDLRLLAPDKDVDELANKIIEGAWKNRSGSRLLPKDIFAYKQKYGKTVAKLFGKDQLSDRQMASLGGYDIIKDIVDDVSGQQISELTGIQHKLFKISEALAKSRDKLPVGIGAITPKAPGVSRPLQAAAGYVGKLARVVGSPGVPEAAGQLAPLAAQAGRFAVPQTAAALTTQPEGEIPTGLTGTGVDTLTRATTGTSAFNGIPTTGVSVDDYINQMATVFGGQAAGKLSKDQSNARSGLRAIQDLKGYIYDPKGGIRRGLIAKAKLPFTTGEASEYETLANEAQDVLQRMRTGAAINEREYKFYAGQLPKVTDSPEAVRRKLEILERLFTEVSLGVAF